MDMITTSKIKKNLLVEVKNIKKKIKIILTKEEILKIKKIERY
jgi:hypothetical protein